MRLGIRLVLVAMLVAGASCSSESNTTTGDHGGGGGGGTGGSGTGGSVTGGSAGSATGGVSGSGGSGGAQSGAGGTAGSSTGGAAGSVSGAGGSAGRAGATACERDDDCVVAQTYSATGCCSRGCGVALNGQWVLNEPCATANHTADPVPTSCNTGCALCPQDPRCQVVFDAICLDGTCTAVTEIGPCAVDDDCVLAIDYESQFGGCCGCESVASRTTLEHAPCIAPASDPRPQGCNPPPDTCTQTTCPMTCGTPMNLRCSAGRCASG
jgi:hypothetical protein